MTLIVLAPDASVAQMLLSENDCAFIRRYDSENDYSFVSDFSYMAHHVDSGPDCNDCFLSLLRRGMDVRITLHGISILQESDSVAGALVMYSYLMMKETMLSVELETASLGEPLLGGWIAIFFIDRSNVHDAIDLFDGRPGFQRELSGFVRPENTCFTSMPEWTQHREISFVFINTEFNRSPDYISSCVRQELYNASGLRGDPQGDIGLFSNIRWRGQALPPPLYYNYGLRDQIMMRLLYDEAFSNGQTYQETFVDAQQIVSQCYAD